MHIQVAGEAREGGKDDGKRRLPYGSSVPHFFRRLLLFVRCLLYRSFLYLRVFVWLRLITARSLFVLRRYPLRTSFL